MQASANAPPLSATTQQPAPLLLLLKGHPGSGKSTLARALAQALRWPLIDKDDARDALQAISSQAAQAGIDLNALAYDIMFRAAATQLSLGLSTINDCPMARLELYERAAALAQQHGANIALVDCQPGDEAVWRHRLESRAAAEAATHTGHKPQTWEQLQQLIARYAMLAVMVASSRGQLFTCL